MDKRDLLKKRRGFALVLTLLVITTLTGLTLGFSEESSTELDLAGFSRDGFIAYEMARSGISLALGVLEKDENKQMDSLREDWAQPVVQEMPGVIPEEMALTGKIVDESGKFNINTLRRTEGDIDGARKAQLIRLFTHLGIDEDRVPPFLDWLDADNIEEPGGAESNYYESLETAYPCANGKFITMGQMFLVKGVREMQTSLQEGVHLQDFLTIHTDGMININTAPVEVLLCLSDKMDMSTAEGIVAYRKETDFLKIEDLKNVPVDDALYNDIKAWITVKSGAFSMEAQGVYQDTEGRVRAVALKDENGLRLVYWKVE